MSVMRHEVLWVECPTCWQKGAGPRFITRDWDGSTYGFACGHEHHLNTTSGGARTWLALDEPVAEEAGKLKEEEGSSG